MITWPTPVLTRRTYRRRRFVGVDVYSCSNSLSRVIIGGVSNQLTCCCFDKKRFLFSTANRIDHLLIGSLPPL